MMPNAASAISAYSGMIIVAFFLVIKECEKREDAGSYN